MRALSFVLVGAMLAPVAFSQTAERRRGDSEFERMVAELGGLPSSFASLVDRAEGLTAYGPLFGLVGNEEVDGVRGPVAYTYWNPDTRAPEHGVTSLPHPRRLAAVGNTFFGYNESTNELQVISWNAAEGTNEFYIVENFGVAGGAPRIRRQPPDGGECRTCHMNMGPIMTPFPWAEFNGPDPTDTSAVRRRIQAAREEAGLPPMGALGVGLGADPVVREFDTNATILDDGVRDSNLRTGRAARICREGCGTDPACRRAVLLGTLLGTLEADQSGGSRLGSVATDVISGMTARWPADGFAFISDVIRDRDTFDSSTRSTGGRSTRLRITDPARAWAALQARVASMNETDLTRAFRFQPEARRAISRLRPDDLAGEGVEERLQYLFRAGVDTAFLFEGVEGATITLETGTTDGGLPGSPAETRPRVGALAGPAEFFLPPEVAFSELRACFGIEFVSDIAAIREFSEAEIRARMASPAVVALVDGDAWPPTRSTLLGFLRTGTVDAAGPCGVEAHERALPVEAGTVELLRETAEATDSLLEPDRPAVARAALQTYCASCHGPESRRPLDLGDLRALSNYRDGMVIDRLAGRGGAPMPPPVAAQPSDTQRQAILDALRAAN